MVVANKDRIIGFDIARGVSIIWVVLYHSLDYSDLYYSHASIKTLTYASLAIFTFLSGFLLASRYDFTVPGRTKEFFKRRLLRFYPLFLISSILLCLMGFNTWFNTAKGLLGLSPFWSPHPRTMWYCAMLISLYLITPFWAKGGFWKQIIKFVVSMGIIVAIHMFFHSVVTRTFFYFPFYFIGIMIAQYGYRPFLSFLSTPKYSVLLMIAFVGIWIVEVFTNNSLLKWVNSVFGMVALLSLYVCLGNKCNDNERKIALISLLSYASLCVYLFHREVDETLLLLWQPANSYMMFLYVGIFGLIITIPLAYYIQKGYDRIINKMNL